ncbi:MAG: hypothetical protein U0929_16120 [Planctomycetaceae bacterium]
MSSPAPARSRSLQNLSDTEWLQSLSATIRSPVEWQSALREGDIRQVARQLRSRFEPYKKLGLIASLRWSADPTVDAVTIEAIDELSRLSTLKGRQATEMQSGMVEAWLDRHPPSAVPSLLDQLLACAILIDRSSRLSDGVLIRLWRFVEEHTGPAASSSGTHHPAVRELLATEMQLMRLVVSAELPLKKSHVEPVVTAVRQFLGTFADEDGCPLAAIHSSLAAALAVILRFSDLFKRLDLKLGDAKDRVCLEKLATRAILLFPIDCSWVPSRTPHEAIDWMQSVSTLAVSDSSEAIAKLQKIWKRVGLESKSDDSAAPKKHRTRSVMKKKQIVSHQSDSADYALLQGDWRESRDRCVARFHQNVPSVEVSILEQLLIQGDWTASVTAGGQNWTGGEWSCCCWFSDTEADFCELTWKPAPGVTVFRQLLWSRVDHFLFIAEEVRAPGLTGVSLESQLPLATGWKAMADGRSREWQLRHGSTVARVLPLFMAQERVQSADGHLSCEDQKILLRSVAEHSGFYNAVVIDWDVSRRESPVQWGPLTVAEEGKRVPPHLASAARWRFDDDLWIVFHQAVRGDNARSALGMHSSQETVVSRVKDGRYLSFVEVD